MPRAGHVGTYYLVEALEQRQLLSGASKLPDFHQSTNQIPGLTAPAGARRSSALPTLTAAVGEYILVNAVLPNAVNPAAFNTVNTIKIQITTGWGDGTFTNAGFSWDAFGALHIANDHTYSRPGNFRVTFYTFDTATGTPVLRPHRLVDEFYNVQATSANGRIVTAKPGAPTSPAVIGTLARLPGFLAAATAQPFITRPATGSELATLLRPHINWGDATQSDGLLRSNASGNYDILATHTYASPGAYRITIDMQPSYNGGATWIYPFYTFYSLALVGNVPGNGRPLTFPLSNLHNDFPVIPITPIPIVIFDPTGDHRNLTPA